MAEPNWDDVDAILSDLDKDDREGVNVVVVQQASWKVWDNGDRTRKLSLSIDGRGGKLFLDIPEKMYSKAEYDAESPNWEDGKKRGVSLTMRIRKGLHDHYGIDSLEALTEGVKFAAEIKRDKPKAGYEKGFLRVVKILPINAVGKGGAAPADAGPGF